jgi:hypothetical protein
MYRINQNQEIIGLLLRAKELEKDYPVQLFSARRTSFLTLITRYIRSWVRF